MMKIISKIGSSKYAVKHITETEKQDVLNTVSTVTKDVFKSSPLTFQKKNFFKVTHYQTVIDFCDYYKKQIVHSDSIDISFDFSDSCIDVYFKKYSQDTSKSEIIYLPSYVKITPISNTVKSIDDVMKKYFTIKKEKNNMTQEISNLINKLYVDTYNHISMSSYKTRNKNLGTLHLNSTQTKHIIYDLLLIEQNELTFMKKLHDSKILKSIKEHLYSVDTRYQKLLETVDYKELLDTLSEIEENNKIESV